MGAPGLDFEIWETTTLQVQLHAVRDLVGGNSIKYEFFRPEIQNSLSGRFVQARRRFPESAFPAYARRLTLPQGWAFLTESRQGSSMLSVDRSERT